MLPGHHMAVQPCTGTVTGRGHTTHMLVGTLVPGHLTSFSTWSVLQSPQRGPMCYCFMYPKASKQQPQPQHSRSSGLWELLPVLNILWQAFFSYGRTLSFSRDSVVHPVKDIEQKQSCDLKCVHLVYDSENFITPVPKNSLTENRLYCECLEKPMFSRRGSQNQAIRMPAVLFLQHLPAQ